MPPAESHLKNLRSSVLVAASGFIFVFIFWIQTNSCYLGLPAIASEIQEKTEPTLVSNQISELATAKTLMNALPERCPIPTNDWVRESIIINATPKTVWLSVHEERKNDPDLAYSKILEQNGNWCKLEQKFLFLPLLGSSICTISEIETPGERIDYHLLNSDRFKCLEGSWILIPLEDGKSTRLDLLSHVDFGLPLPKTLVNLAVSRKLDRRLHHVKTLAEKIQKKDR